jgi:hypothetical protein
MDTCDYKSGVTLDKWQNTTSCKKTPHGMYSHTKGCVSFTTAYMTTKNIGQHFLNQLNLNDLIYFKAHLSSTLLI